MDILVRFGVSLKRNLLKDFDRIIRKKGYSNRSEAIRDLIREFIVDLDWGNELCETAGVISLVYNHETRELGDKLTNIQHKYYKSIISTTHIHLDHHNCLEVIVVKGKVRELKKLADKLTSTKGVIHGKFMMTTTGKKLI